MTLTYMMTFCFTHAGTNAGTATVLHQSSTVQPTTQQGTYIQHTQVRNDLQAGLTLNRDTNLKLGELQGILLVFIMLNVTYLHINTLYL